MNPMLKGQCLSVSGPKPDSCFADILSDISSVLDTWADKLS